MDSLIKFEAENQNINDNHICSCNASIGGYLIHYSLIGRIGDNRKDLTSYFIRIVIEDGKYYDEETVFVGCIESRGRRLFKLFVDNTVTPCGINDVISDYIEYENDLI